MADLDITYIIAHKKSRRGISEFSDYATLSAPIALILIMGFAYCSVINTADTELPFSRALLFLIICTVMVLSVGLLYLIIVRLKQNVFFKSIATPFSKADNYQLALELLTLEHCKTVKYPDYITGDTKISFFSWGEQITVIPLDKEILINSHPNSSRQPVTIIKDVKNIEKFERQINAAVANRV